MLFTVAAAFLVLASVLSLFTSWRARQKSVLITTTGWLALAAAIGLWSQAVGAEFGTSFSLILLPILAWVVMLINADTRRQKIRPQVRGQMHGPSVLSFLLHLGRVIGCVVLSGAASAYLCMGLVTLLPISPVNAIVLAVFIIPLVWGAAAYWLCADTTQIRPPIAIALAGILGGALIHV